MNAYAITMRRLRQTAPVMSLAAALVLPQLFPHEPGTLAADGVELEMVAAAVESVPYRIGEWVGRDVPIPEAARRLLRPNAILSRRYVHLQTGRRVDLAIVHCGDSRDMLGHYPPICYPSNGWVSTARFTGDDWGDAEVESPLLRLGNLSIPARTYLFSRAHGPSAWAGESHIRVFNFFILPNGTITGNIEEVGLRANWLGAWVHGVAQIQILTDQAMSAGEAAHAASEVLEGVSAVFNSLGVKQGAHSQELGNRP